MLTPVLLYKSEVQGKGGINTHRHVILMKAYLILKEHNVAF